MNDNRHRKDFKKAAQPTIPEDLNICSKISSRATESMIERRKVKLEEIVMSDQTKSREVNDSLIAEYTNVWKEGARFAPVDIFDTGGVLHLADGFHRTQSALNAGLTEIEAIIHKGTLVEALKYSLGANSVHGMRRSQKDKRYAVNKAIVAFPGQSSNSLAQMVGVSHTFVDSIRGKLNSGTQLATDACSEVRLGLDGKKRRVRKAKARLNQTKPAKLADDVLKPQPLCPPFSPALDDLESATMLFTQYLTAMQAAKFSMPDRSKVVNRASTHLSALRTLFSGLTQN